MEIQNQQGGAPSPAESIRRPLSETLYRIGPLRLRPQVLKTVKAYIRQSRLRHNAARLKEIIGPGVALCAVVKANGYGHCARDIVRTLNAPLAPAEAAGRRDYAFRFAVSHIEEAEDIHPFVTRKDILVTGPLFAGMDPALIELAQVRRFHCTVCSPGILAYLERVLAPDREPLPVHLKVDTGMGRAGCGPDEAPALIERIRQSGRLRLAGVYTHFATADQSDGSFVDQQFAGFEKFLADTRLAQDTRVVKHAANTSAALQFPAARLDMVRCGIGLYGYAMTAAPAGAAWDFRPVLRVEAPLIQVKTIRAGQSCGYGRTFVARRDTPVGIVPVGYADGLFRNLSNRAVMRCGQRDLPIVGRISMDMTAVDLSGVPDAGEGMTVTVLDDQPGSPCNAQALAELAGTIPYEILTALGSRIKRVLID